MDFLEKLFIFRFTFWYNYIFRYNFLSTLFWWWKTYSFFIDKTERGTILLSILSFFFYSLSYSNFNFLFYSLSYSNFNSLFYSLSYSNFNFSFYSLSYSNSNFLFYFLSYSCFNFLFYSWKSPLFMKEPLEVLLAKEPFRIYEPRSANFFLISWTTYLPLLDPCKLLFSRRGGFFRLGNPVRTNGEPMTNQWRTNGEPMANQWRTNGEPMTNQWRSKVYQWRTNGEPMAIKRISERRTVSNMTKKEIQIPNKYPNT